MARTDKKIPDDVIREIITKKAKGENLNNLCKEAGIHVSSYYGRIKAFKKGLPKQKRAIKKIAKFIDVPIERATNDKVAIIVTNTSALRGVLEGLWK